MHHVAEAVLIQLDSHLMTKLAHRLRDLHTNGKHRHVEAFAVAIAVFILVMQNQIVVPGIFMQSADSAAVVLDTIAISGPFKITPIAFGEGAHIHHEYVDVQIRVMLFSDE